MSERVDRIAEESDSRPEALLTLYLWFALLLTFGYRTFSASGDALSLMKWAGTLTALALLSIAVRVSPAGRQWTQWCCIGAAVLIELFLLAMVLRHPSIAGRELAITVILVFVPSTWLTLWSWRTQATLGGAIWLPIVITLVRNEGLIGAGKALLLAVALTLLTTLLRSLQRREPRARYAGPLAPIQLLAHAWPVTALQMGLLLVLVFSDLVLWREASASIIALRVYGVALVLLGSLLLSVIRPQYRAYLFLANTLAIALLSVAAAAPIGDEAMGTVERTIPAIALTLLALTTVGLPWSFGLQVVEVWILTIIGLSYYGLGSVLNGPSAAALSLAAEGIVVLSCGMAAALVGSRLVGELRATEIPRDKKADDELGRRSRWSPAPSGGQPFGAEQLLRNSAREGIAFLRVRALVPLLLIIGVVATAFSTLLLGGLHTTQLGYLGFYLLWVCVAYLSRRRFAQEHLWFLAALSALFLLLWSCCVLVLSGTTDALWLFFPLFLIVSFGFIPWRFGELFPLTLAGLLMGTTTASRVADPHFGLVFLAASILSLYLAATAFRRVREEFILREFHRALSQCEERTDVLRIFADYLGTLFNAHAVLISWDGSHLELIRESRAYQVAPAAWSLSELRERIEDLAFDEQAVGIHAVNWLDRVVSFSNPDFGAFVAEHGLLIELPGAVRPPNARREVVREISRDDRALLFVPLKVPFAEHIMGSEIRLARTLSGETLLCLRMFSERELRSAVERANFALQGERDYELSSLVHDINNTVQDQALICESLVEELGPPDAGPGRMLNDGQLRTLISKIQRIAVSSRTMATVVSDVKRKRELDRLEDLAPRELVDLGSVVREAVPFAQSRSERRRINVAAPEQNELDDLWVRVSSFDHLETVVRSVLGNAITRSEPGSEVRIVVKRSNEWAWLEVTDTGPRLSKEECRMIFIADDSVSWGMGEPGMKQLRRFAEAQGGALDVRSDAGARGATFSLVLPVQAAPGERASNHAWALIVDDEPALGQSYSRIARALRLEPSTAATLDEARALLEELGKPALVVTDLHLGQESGVDIVTVIRERFGAKVPIVVVSGESDEQVKERLHRAGASEFVAKPVGQRALFLTFQSLLERSRI